MAYRFLATDERCKYFDRISLRHSPYSVMQALVENISTKSFKLDSRTLCCATDTLLTKICTAAQICAKLLVMLVLTC